MPHLQTFCKHPVSGASNDVSVVSTSGRHETWGQRRKCIDRGERVRRSQCIDAPRPIARCWSDLNRPDLEGELVQTLRRRGSVVVGGEPGIGKLVSEAADRATRSCMAGSSQRLSGVVQLVSDRVLGYRQAAR